MKNFLDGLGDGLLICLKVAFVVALILVCVGVLESIF